MLEQAIITIGAVLAIVAIILGYIFLKSSGGKSYLPYIPGFILGVAGIILACVAVTGKVTFWNAGLGGWGIGCLFAAGISSLVTSVSHAYQVHDEN